MHDLLQISINFKQNIILKRNEFIWAINLVKKKQR